MAGRILCLMIAVLLSSCAQLYHVQLGDIDNTRGGRKVRVMVSESGLNLKEAGKIARALAPKSRADEGLEIVRMFQMGPRTGNPVYNATYARDLHQQLRRTCPRGHITGITAVREARKYPVISGEIVRIVATCNGGG